MAKVTLDNLAVCDAYMALLAGRGIDDWFADTGSDFAPVVGARRGSHGSRAVKAR